MRTNRVGNFVFGLLLWASAGFAIAGEANSKLYSDTSLQLLAGDRLLVFPMVFDYPEVEKELEQIQTALMTELKTVGLSPANIRLTDEISLQAITLLADAQVGEAQKKIIRKEFALYAADSAEYKIALFPSVINRKAKRRRDKITWDGASHRIAVGGSIKSISAHSVTDAFQQTNPIEKTARDAQYNALSLRLDAYNNEGVWLFTTFGGISVPYYMDTDKNNFDKKKLLFKEERDREYLVEGVTKACLVLERKINNTEN